MTTSIEAVGVIVIVAAIGYALKKAGVLTKEDGDFLAGKLLFYIGLPALVFNTISQARLTQNFPVFFISSIFIVLAMCAAGWIAANALKLERKTRGSFVTGVSIMNLGMVTFSFFYLTYGAEGLARSILFDIGNALLVYSLVYYVAVRHGNNELSRLQTVKRVFTLPMLWAFLLALFVNITGLAVPGLIMEVVNLVSSLTLPLLLLTLGIYFELSIGKNLFPLLTGTVLRVFGGLAIGLVLAYIFNLSGLDKTVLVLSAAAPAGYNSIVYAIKENLDKEFAASLVSISIVLSLVVITAGSIFI